MSTPFFLFNARRADTLKTLESLMAQRGLDLIVVMQAEGLPEAERVDDMACGKIRVRDVEEHLFPPTF